MVWALIENYWQIRQEVYFDDSAGAECEVGDAMEIDDELGGFPCWWRGYTDFGFPEFPRIFQNFPEFCRIFQKIPEFSRHFQNFPGRIFQTFWFLPPLKRWLYDMKWLMIPVQILYLWLRKPTFFDSLFYIYDYFICMITTFLVNEVFLLYLAFI